MMKSRALFTKKIVFSVLVLSLPLGLGACSKKSASSDPNAQSQLRASSTATDKAEIAAKIEAGEPLTLMVLFRPESYARAVKLLTAFEKDELLRVKLNPNTSNTSVDVAPFMVIEFTSKFFAGSTPEDLFGALGVESFGLDRMTSLPKAAAVDAPVSPKGYMPVQAMHAREVGTSGKGIKVAVIDTGIDLGHPAFRDADGKMRKVIDFVDFTGEGKFKLIEATAADADTKANDAEACAGVKQSAGAFAKANAGMRVFSTCLQETRVVDGKTIKIDLDGDGSSDGEIAAMVLLDEAKNRVAVLVDSNQDGEFTEDELKPVFTSGRDLEPTLISLGTGRLKGIRKVTANVKRELGSDQLSLEIGFDQVGHGTHVSGIIAGRMNTPQGLYEGVAPDASLMALKVCQASEGCPSSAIMSAMIYAAKNGAQLANMSLGGGEAQDPDALGPKLTRYLTQRYGILFVMAAGNEGPSMNTGGDPGNHDAALTIGAYNPADSQRDNYGLVGGSGAMFWWSSRGPTFFGALKPDVIAPGGALSSIPQASGQPVDMWNGTSMAAPMATGLAALVLQKGLDADLAILRADRFGSLSQRPLALKRAIQDGAQPIDNALLIEQGYGLVNGVTSAGKLAEFDKVFQAQLAKNPDFRLFRYLKIDGNFYQKNGGDAALKDVHLVEFLDPSRPQAVDGIDPEKALDVVSQSPWIKVKNVYGQDSGDRVSNIQSFTRNSSFSYEIDQSKKPQELGMQNAFLEIRDSETGIAQGRILVTDINATTLDQTPSVLEDGISEGTYRLDLGELTIKSFENRRIYVRVPKGATALGVITQATGDARVVVSIAGNGQALAQDADNVFVQGGRKHKERATTVAPTAGEGIYEVVITGLSNVPESKVKVEIRASGLVAPPMAMGAEGKAITLAMDGLRTNTSGVKAVASPWLTVDAIDTQEASLSMGSTMLIPAEVEGEVQAMANGADAKSPSFFTAEFLSESLKPLKEGVDFVKGPSMGLKLFPKKTKVVIAVHAEFVAKGADQVEVAVMKVVQGAPRVKVVAKGEASYAVIQSDKSPDTAIALLYWLDGYLNFGAPTATTVIGNLMMSPAKQERAVKQISEVLRNRFANVVDDQ